MWLHFEFQSVEEEECRADRGQQIQNDARIAAFCAGITVFS
jgi:hypothetical protein